MLTLMVLYSLWILRMSVLLKELRMLWVGATITMHLDTIFPHYFLSTRISLFAPLGSLVQLDPDVNVPVLVLANKADVLVSRLAQWLVSPVNSM
jgi:hypothetical protein